MGREGWLRRWSRPHWVAREEQGGEAWVSLAGFLWPPSLAGGASSKERGAAIHSHTHTHVPIPHSKRLPSVLVKGKLLFTAPEGPGLLPGRSCAQGSSLPSHVIRREAETPSQVPALQGAPNANISASGVNHSLSSSSSSLPLGKQPAWRTVMGSWP